MTERLPPGTADQSADSAAGEMPFLDHLEELRWRILKSLIALVVGVVAGYAVVRRYDVVGLLKRPIDPYLPPGQALIVTSPMDPFIITLKLAVAIGVLVALPVAMYQAWAFLRPALYDRERRVVLPTVLVGTLMFAGGAAVGFLWVLPLALDVLSGFVSGSMQQLITAQAYFGFALTVVIAFGAVFEVPLVMFVLIYLRMVSAAFLRRHRRAFILINAVASALLTPGDIIIMTAVVMIPLQLFYELSIVMAVMMERRRRRAAAAEAAEEGAAVAAPRHV
jgi:sec-independent protein translocase protein TatC